MKMLLTVSIPHEPFNELVRDGTVGEIISKILQETKPETAYFTEEGGQRGAVLVINVENSSQVPSFSEPWFLHFNADCKFRIAMTPEDLKRAHLDELGKKWC